MTDVLSKFKVRSNTQYGSFVRTRVDIAGKHRYCDHLSLSGFTFKRITIYIIKLENFNHIQLPFSIRSCYVKINMNYGKLKFE